MSVKSLSPAIPLSRAEPSHVKAADPWVYLRDVLTRLPAMLPGASDEDLLTLLPHLWEPA